VSRKNVIVELDEKDSCVYGPNNFYIGSYAIGDLEEYVEPVEQGLEITSETNPVSDDGLVRYLVREGVSVDDIVKLRTAGLA
jgi:hypothetical protein